MKVTYRKTCVVVGLCSFEDLCGYWCVEVGVCNVVVFYGFVCFYYYYQIFNASKKMMWTFKCFHKI